MAYPIEGADYFIYLMNLPPHIYAYVRVNSDGTYSVYLDPRRSREQQIDDWSHEIWHILNDDFYNGLPIEKVENL